MSLTLKQELAKTSSPEAQKQFLRTLETGSICKAEHVEPEQGLGCADICRIEGQANTQALSEKISAGNTPTPSEVVNYFNAELKQRICFLDGGMGTRIQAENLQEADYRGDRFKDFSQLDANGVQVSLKGNNDLLIFSQPDMVKDIHKEYFLGGSDVCETNTFNGTSISQGEYKMQEIVYEMNKVGAQLAKKAAAEVTKAEPSKPRFVAGAVGPTSRTLSVSPSVEDPSFRNVTWDELVEAYVEQVRGLVDGGVDMLMIETIFDTQNAKAAIFAVDEYFLQTGKERLPVMISATIVDNSGRTLSGQTIEAFFISIKHAKAFTVGINCALGAGQMKKFYKRLTDMNPGWCHVYPNAGLPNAMGGYDEDPEIFSTNILDYAKDGLLNFVGGCCGTFPSHIAAVMKKCEGVAPRKLPELNTNPCMQLSGLEPCTLNPEVGFQLVGERCNLMGSPKFKKLVDAYKWDEAMEVCQAQVEKKADILDFNFDSDLIDGKSAMGKFMRLCVTEPNVAKLPFMIDSSKWAVIEEGLKCVQGKCIVNSISLKVGEEEYLRQAKLCQRFGAAVVIMAFDENGQAATYEDKVRICTRSYNLLRKKLDFNPEDIIFDCNVLTISTGLPEHNTYAIDFINAVAEIKRVCPGVSFSGGLSNLSFSFRGLNKFRDAMHSVFLYHAVPKGLNMSIVNPGSLPRYADIDPTFRKAAEEVILNQSSDGNHVERFIELAENVRSPPAPEPAFHGLKIEKSSADQQKDFLKSLKCDVSCKSGEKITRLPDVCRIEGSISKEQIAAKIIAGGTPSPSEVCKYFNTELKERICFLDGGMGTRIQAEHLEEADYRGDRFKDFNEIDANGVKVSLKGNNDLLIFSKPDMVKDIHAEYFRGGSDVCETNTFNGTSISQIEYKMQAVVYEMNKKGAELAKQAAAEVTKDEPWKPRFVAGAVGPTSRTLSVSPSVEDSSFRNVTWDDLVESYVEQIRGLVDGGVDMLMIETIFDTQNAKAAIFAVDEYFLQSGKERLPVMLSATIVDNSGRTLSGQTIEAFFVSVKHARAYTIGINCALGAAQMKKFYRQLTDINPGWCHVYPNAGLPNAMGGYDEDPEIFSTNIYDYAKDGLLNFVGGCCGTFPSHIAAVANKVKDCAPRALPALPEFPSMQLSGLEPHFLKPESGFQFVGERCNLMGSAKFKKLVDGYKWDEAMDVCLAQTEKKADILDFNFDSDLIDGKDAMSKFMRMCVTEPNVARLPFMIDSSKWAVIEEGLKCVQGKCIVNSISLKVGEEEFLRQAKLCQRFGAAVVIMAFDEQGQAATFEDKVRICTRSYNLLRSSLDFNPEDIIFDCNVLTIATGLPEHNGYAIDFINAVAEIKRTCPCVSFSGGLSNLSFSFRGLNSLRDAMHSVFLYHAVPKGLNMSIVNPGSLPRYEDIDARSRALCEEVILNKSTDGNHVERFLEYAEKVKNPPAAPAAAPALTILKSTPAQQKELLRSLTCEVSCEAEHVVAEASAGMADICRLEGTVDKKQLVDKIIACETPSPSDIAKYFNKELQERICFLDGGMGTRIQAENLQENDYRGERFKDFHMIDANGVPVSLKGNNDLLIFSKPDMVKDIHKEYFLGGSDICETNTFNGTSVSQIEYQMQDIVYEMNKVGAQLAKKAAAEVTKDEPGKPRFVAGAVGPTSRTLSVSPSVEDSSFRNVTWDELVEAYVEQISGLVDGGVDMLMIETIFDTQNAKAAIFAVDEYFLKTGKDRLPVMLSATIVDNSGRTLSGQTIEAFFISIKHAKPFTVGINCALGAGQMKKFYKQLTDMCPGWCHVYPNAGLPNAMGGYDETPEIFSTNIYDYAKDGLLNFVGGCCGTFPSHIAAVAKKCEGVAPRKLPVLPKYPYMQLSGLEPCLVKPEVGFQWVGERCNLMGSAKFKKLVDAYKWDDAMEVCLAQCDKMADVLDFNFDSDLIDGQAAMSKFMRMCVTEPNVAKLPFMIDSSKWNVIEEGLKCCQGKCIVNSISLKVGEEEFLRQAKLCQRFGAAVVIMAFDENGQAATYDEKVRICTRSYKLLRTKLDFAPEDIIFDCNVLTIATGLPEHNGYGIDFINAVAEIKRTCPCVSFSGGLSNLSFSFRGLNSVRDAMHSVFLYHAVKKGLNMSIVNPGGLPRYQDIDENTRKLCEEVILNKSADGNHVERFLEFAENAKKPAAAATGAAGGVPAKDAWRNGTYVERLHHGLINGIDKFIVGDVEEARLDMKVPLHIIEGPLMEGMGIIGDLFGAGKMFLPQVIKSARVMKKAVAHLTPFMDEEKRLAAIANGTDPDQPKWNGVVLMATVKGDVHDIGKNIVGVVLGCNNYKVIDMGVMVPCEKILERALEEKVDIIGLSGLITPSLDEMVNVAEEMKKRGMTLPLMIGGATTSKRHTAVRVQTKYDHGVIHVLDASRSCTVVSACLSDDKKSYLADIKEEYQEIREEYYASLIDKKWKTLAQAQKMKPEMDWTQVPPAPKIIGNQYLKEHSIAEIVEYIDWTPFFQVYQLRGKYPNRDYPAIFKDERVGEEASKLFAEAKEMLEWIVKDNILQASGVVGVWPANSVGDDIEVYSDEKRDTVTGKFYGLRQQLDMGEKTYWCQSDFIAPKGVAPDYIAAFACTGGLGCHKQRQIFEDAGEIDRAILLEAVADRLAEAFAELIHLKIRKTLWGYAPDEALSLDDLLKVRYQGIRPAPGYPSQPDHREKKTMWDLLDVDRLTENKLELTESYMMLPGASVSALVFAHPQAKYFSVGQVNKDQVASYSERRGESGVEGTERWLGSTVLGYEKK